MRFPWALFQVTMGQRFRIVQTRRYCPNSVIVVFATLDAVQGGHAGRCDGQQNDRHDDQHHYGRWHNASGW